MTQSKHTSSTIQFDIADDYQGYTDQALSIKTLFDQSTDVLQQGRNVIKNVVLKDNSVVVKSFRKPNILRGWIYARITNGKAKKSFLHAKKLLSNNVDTPEPIAYLEEFEGKRLTHSYYLAAYKEHDLTMKDVFIHNSEENSLIIQQFTHFTFSMHQAGILHLDHSANNTLISKTKDGYQFSVIDINRLWFGKVSVKKGLKNFVRLTDNNEAMKTIASTYAACTQTDPDYCQKTLFKLKRKHVGRLNTKRRLKALFK